MIAVVEIGPQSYPLLTPFLAKRIEEYAREYQPEDDPVFFSQMVLKKLWGGDLDILILGIVDTETAQLVGHAVASLETHGLRQYVYVSQIRVGQPGGSGQNVGTAKQDALEKIHEWTKSLGVTQVLLATNRDGRDMAEKYGYRKFRTLHRLDLTVADSNPTR